MADALNPFGNTFRRFVDMGDGTVAERVVAVAGVADSTDGVFNPDSLPQVLAYSGGKLSTISVTDGTSTWIQTYTYTGDDLTGVSVWVKQ